MNYHGHAAHNGHVRTQGHRMVFLASWPGHDKNWDTEDQDDNEDVEDDGDGEEMKMMVEWRMMVGQ